MHIRQATSQDAALLAALNGPVQQLHAENRPDVFKPAVITEALVQSYEDLLAAAENHFFIAEQDEEAVGYIGCRELYRPETVFTHALDGLYIDQISVNSSCRHQGVGTRLIQSVLALAREKHIARVTLDVWGFNHDAQQFFVQQGFSTLHLRMEQRLE